MRAMATVSVVSWKKKETESGIHGVVADLIQVKKQYETAIETALSSNVQNIVTEDEETAKRMIRYLKEKTAMAVRRFYR